MMSAVRQIVPCLALAAVLGAATGIAFAAPTGLNIIPTADLLSKGEIVLEYQADGVRLFDAKCNHWALLEIGFSDRFEAGVDRCFGGDTATFGNAKLLFFTQDEHRPALVVGLQGLGEAELGEPYTVASKNAGRARLHLGAIRRGGEIESMLGAELPLARHFTLLADHVSGPDRLAGIGINANLSRVASLKLSRIFANSSADDDAWQFIATFSFSPGPRE